MKLGIEIKAVSKQNIGIYHSGHLAVSRVSLAENISIFRDKSLRDINLSDIKNRVAFPVARKNKVTGKNLVLDGVSQGNSGANLVRQAQHVEGFSIRDDLIGRLGLLSFCQADTCEF
ncbi:hypothetical protein SDC9_152578 [bioreactor metagenome]|uniref:Uncharacterized protein n=1 Tax=bioreactor metagenome TaxID=1076179 RepID=A0A645ETF5_9ZZZZ